MVLAGIKAPDAALVRDAIDLERSSLQEYLFNHVNVVRQKPATTMYNILRDFGIRYVEGFHPSELRRPHRKRTIFRIACDQRMTG